MVRKSFLRNLGAFAVTGVIVIASSSMSVATTTAALGERCPAPCPNNLCGGTKGCACNKLGGQDVCEQKLRVVDEQLSELEAVQVEVAAL